MLPPAGGVITLSSVARVCATPAGSVQVTVEIVLKYVAPAPPEAEQLAPLVLFR